MAGGSLSHGKSGHADRKVITAFLIIQRQWDQWPLLFSFLPGVWTQRPGADAGPLPWLPGCSRKQSLEVKHQQGGWSFLGQGEQGEMWEPCVGTGGDEPAFLPPGDQERPPGGSACPDSEGEARDEDLKADVGWLNKAGVEWISHERAVERVRELGGVVFSDYKSHICSQ